MATFGADIKVVSLEGEIVEIREEDGERLARIVLTAPVIIDMANGWMAEAHLGDRVVVRAWIGGVGIRKEGV
jgi:hypothetical protein